MNDLNTVRRVLALLGESDARCWLFGGWAEELRGLRAPGPHSDIDILYRAACFSAVDGLLARREVEEIEGKHFPHKRAFLFDGVMTELFLVDHDELGLHTLFWGDTRHDWPRDTLDSLGNSEMPLASVAALVGFRREHVRLAAGYETYLARRIPKAPQ